MNLIRKLYGCLTLRDKDIHSQAHTVNRHTLILKHLHTQQPSHRYTNTVRLRDESFGLDYSTNTPAVSHQGVPVSIFFTQGAVLLILTFKSLSLTSVCSSPDLYFTARIADGNQFGTRCNIWSTGYTLHAPLDHS